VSTRTELTTKSREALFRDDLSKGEFTMGWLFALVIVVTVAVYVMGNALRDIIDCLNRIQRELSNIHQELSRDDAKPVKGSETHQPTAWIFRPAHVF
jgi:hypothetical protein